MSLQGVGGARDHLRKLQQAFGGSEVLATNLDTGPARANLRVLDAAARAVSTPEAPFYLYVNTPRLPGFFFDEDIDTQPDVYRAKALRSDGREWPRRPPEKAETQSFISFSGTALDVSRGPAVDALMEKVGRVFRAECGQPTACVGPLHGFVVIDEAQVSTPCTPCDEVPAHAEHADVLEAVLAAGPAEVVVLEGAHVDVDEPKIPGPRKKRGDGAEPERRPHRLHLHHLHHLHRVVVRVGVRRTLGHDEEDVGLRHARERSRGRRERAVTRRSLRRHLGKFRGTGHRDPSRLVFRAVEGSGLSSTGRTRQVPQKVR